MIYLDNSATSPIDEEVRDAMLPYLSEEFGNPSSKYYCKATNAKAAVEEAREKVAKLIGAKPEEIIFTAGATESTNFIIKGYLDYRKYYGDGKNHVITSLVEHKATLNTCRYLNGELYSNNDPTISLFGEKKRVDRGFEASFVGVTSDGEISVEEIEKAIKENTALVSILHVNNEIGSISDVSRVSEICKSHNIALHSDLTQALGKLEIDVKKLGIDYASCSAHKIYGPKGIGAAYMKSDAYGIAPITAFMHGGEQEFGYRAGTHAVHNIVAFGKAAEIALRDMKKNETHIQKLDELLLHGIANIDGIHTTVDESKRIPGIVSLVVEKEDFHNERFIKKISEEVALSTGSACSAGEPSYVIQALGLGDKVTKVLRVSINKFTTESDINEFIKLLRAEI
ncbi:MAG: cysteine desulfurase family protein [Agathobacter sp.]|nr:cysteine desulfurase family protein [Agathobacter sp.]